MAVIIKLKKQSYAYLDIKVINEYEGFIADAKVEIFPQSGQG
jgi:hypothetical protein